MRILLVCVAGLLMVAQIVWAVWIGRDRKERPGSRATTSGLLLAALSPVLLCLIGLVGLHLSRSHPFEVVGSPSAATKQAFLAALEAPPLAGLGSLKWFLGLGLFGLAATGASLGLLAWRNLRRANDSRGPLVFLGFSLSLLSGLVGLAAWLSEQDSLRLAAAWERALAGPVEPFTRALSSVGLPNWFWWLTWVMVGLVILAGGWLAWRRRASGQLGGWGLAAGLALLGLGAAAFAFTRAHTHDMSVSLPAMLRPDGPEVVETALLGRLEHDMLQVARPKIPADLQLPRSKSGLGFRYAVSLAVTPRRLLVEGNQIATLEAGRLPAGPGGSSPGRVEPLFNLLTKFREIERSEKVPNSSGDETVVALMADRGVPYETVFAVMRTAAEAGSPNFRLLVQGSRRRPLSKVKLAVINASLPTLDSGTILPPGKAAQGPAGAAGRVTALVQVSADRLTATLSGEQPEEVLAQYWQTFEGAWPDRLAALADWCQRALERFPGSDTILLLPSRQTNWQQIIDCLDATRERIVDPTLDRRQAMFTNAVLSRIIE